MDAHGKFEFKIRIGGFTLAQVTGSYTLHVVSAAQPLTLTPASGPLPDETVGQPATGSIAISGGTPPFTLVSASGLPDGVTAAIGPDGASVVLSGAPTAAGDASVTVVVADSGA